MISRPLGAFVRLCLALVAVSLLAVPGSSPAAAGVTVLSPAALAEKGIDMKLFSLVAFSRDGSVLVGVERIKDLALKQRGYASQLRVFRWRGTQCTGVDTIPLPTTAFEQLALSPDGVRAVVVGEGGSKFILVDLRAGTARVAWTHHRGTPGFRSSQVAWWHGQGFLLLGYLHNALDQLTYEGVVQLDLSRNGPEMFKPALDIRPIVDQLKAVSFAMYVDPTQAFFGCMPRTGVVDIYAFSNGSLRKVDQVVAVGGIASARDRVMYAARLTDGRRDVILRDIRTKQSWKLGRDDLPFSYLFLSTNGKTAITTLMDFRDQTMSYFYAREKDGFRNRPIASLQEVRPGTLRLSGDGHVYAFYGPTGLVYGQLP